MSAIEEISVRPQMTVFARRRFRLAERLTPKVVMWGMVSEVALMVLLYLPAGLGLVGRFRLAESVLMTAAGLIAFGIATFFCFQVSAEYGQARWARLAWQMLAANAALSLLKRVVGSPLIDLFVNNYRTGHLRGLLDNLLFVPANLCLLAGLIAMWWALHRIGVGFKIERRDYAVMFVVAILFSALLIYRENLSQAQSPYQISRVLQPIGLMLLGVISAFGLMLHRYAVQMGDGRLAAVMRWLTLYVLLRGLLVFSGAFLSPKGALLAESASDLNAWVFDVLWQLVPWTAAMAAAYRVQVTVTAAEQLKRLRAGKTVMVSA